MRIALSALALLSAALPAPAHADELFVGLMAHGVDTPLTRNIDETGADMELGWRGDRIDALGALGRPQPHILASVSRHGNTSFLAAGFSWRLGKGPFYARPGIGMAVQSGPTYRVNARGWRTDLGSRILFEPEFSIGLRVTPRVSIEASWVHLSHAQLFSGQNPGLDMMGTRMVVGF